MFSNFKVIAKLGSPVATIDNIILDSLISCAIAKEKLKDEFYRGKARNAYGTEKQLDDWLGKVLDKKDGVFCTSIGFGESREFSSHWSKKFDNKDDDIIKFTGKGKKRIDIARGSLKNYHMPIVLNSYKQMYFYARGDREEIIRLLNEHIHFIGKKASQGYGEVLEWESEDIKEDYSLIKAGKPMRPLPAKNYKELIKTDTKLQEHSRIPPYWRPDCKELCIMP